MVRISPKQTHKAGQGDEISQILYKIKEIKIFGGVKVELSRRAWSQNDSYDQG